jgi:hypothetical protein
MINEEVILTPVPGFKDYLADTLNGKVFSKKSNKYLLQNAKGTGDDNKYLMTALIDSEGISHPMYLHEIIMSSHTGLMKSQWRTIGLEVNHITKNTKDCSISNLELTSSKGNKASKDKFINAVRLSMVVADQLRQEFKNWSGSKVEWYKMKAEEFGVSARSIQNVVLGYTYKEVTE